MAESRVTTVVAEVLSTGGAPHARVTTVAAEVLHTGGVPRARVTGLGGGGPPRPRGADRGRYGAQAHRGRGRGLSTARLELYVDGFSHASTTAAATSTSILFGIYRWGRASRRRKTSTATSRSSRCFASSWPFPIVRRWHADPFGFLRPWNGAACALRQRATRNAPLDRHPAWSPS
jgi:hypothetical protein